jgi:TonB family protein
MLKSKKSKSVWLNVVMLIPILGLLIVILSCDVISPEDFNPNSASTSELISQNIIPSKTIQTENGDTNESATEVFTVVEKQPIPPDGMLAYYQYIQDNLNYPEEAKDQGIEGKVFVQFIVSTDGKLTNVAAVKGIGGGCDEEAVRVVMKSLPWIPGLQNGKKVKVRMILPITFKLG